MTKFFKKNFVSRYIVVILTIFFIFYCKKIFFNEKTFSPAIEYQKKDVFLEIISNNTTDDRSDRNNYHPIDTDSLARIYPFTPNHPNIIEVGWYEFRNEKFDISFLLPKTWEIKEYDHYDPDNDLGIYTVRLTSPELKSNIETIENISPLHEYDIEISIYVDNDSTINRFECSNDMKIVDCLMEYPHFINSETKNWNDNSIVQFTRADQFYGIPIIQSDREIYKVEFPYRSKRSNLSAIEEEVLTSIKFRKLNTI